MEHDIARLRGISEAGQPNRSWAAVTGWRGGDADAPADVCHPVTALYRSHALGLTRVAFLMLGDRHAAEDVVQDAFCGLYRAWDRLPDHASLAGYLRVSVLNGCRSALRRSRRVSPVVAPSVRDGLGVGVQVALGGDQRAVPGDLPEHVNRDTRVGHPGQARVTQIVTAQMLIAELGDDLVPVRCVAQHRRGDPTAARAGEYACCWVVADGIEASFDERAHFFNERDGPGPLTLGALINQAAGTWCGLPPDGPGPGVAVNVGAPDTRHFTDPGRGAGGEDDDIAPSLEVIGRPCDERRS